MLTTLGQGHSAGIAHNEHHLPRKKISPDTITHTPKKSSRALAEELFAPVNEPISCGFSESFSPRHRSDAFCDFERNFGSFIVESPRVADLDAIPFEIQFKFDQITKAASRMLTFNILHHTPDTRYSSGREGEIRKGLKLQSWSFMHIDYEEWEIPVYVKYEKEIQRLHQLSKKVIDAKRAIKMFSFKNLSNKVEESVNAILSTAASVLHKISQAKVTYARLKCQERNNHVHYLETAFRKIDGRIKIRRNHLVDVEDFEIDLEKIDTNLQKILQAAHRISSFAESTLPYNQNLFLTAVQSEVKKLVGNRSLEIINERPNTSFGSTKLQKFFALQINTLALEQKHTLISHKEKTIEAMLVSNEICEIIEKLQKYRKKQQPKTAEWKEHDQSFMPKYREIKEKIRSEKIVKYVIK